MFDSHCHLDFSEFNNQRITLLNSAKEKGINNWLIPGVSDSSYKRFKVLEKLEYNFYFALGLHPYFIHKHDHLSIKNIEKQLDSMTVHAIGETGLDKHKEDFKLQLKLLDIHFQWANQLQLPIILHHRKSLNELYRVAKKSPNVRGIIHAFSGILDEAKQWIDLGYLLGAGGTITYQRANKTRQTFKEISLHDILLETDAPSMPISGKQSDLNKPEYLFNIAQSLAEIRQEELSFISKQTSLNAKNIFNI